MSKTRVLLQIVDPRSASGAADRAVAVTKAAPMEIEGRVIANGEFSGELFIDVDAEAGLFVAPKHSISDFGRAGKNFAQGVGEVGTFLDAEIRSS